MGEMHEMYGAWDNGEYNPCDGDVDEPGGTCVSCGAGFTSSRARLFCGDLCRDEASLVRYVRRCRGDGRWEDPEVRDAITIRMAHLLGGGYDRRSRRLPAGVRDAVIVRDSGRCQSCGGAGTEIDHIATGSNEPGNLQLLCHSCHVKKTLASLRTVMPGDEDYSDVNAEAEALSERFDSPEPLRACDDPDEWATTWPRLLRERRTQWEW